MQPGDKVLFAMSVLANDIKVRESGGNNHGPWVEAILGSTGLDAGYPWCAASCEFSAQVAGVTMGPERGKAAAVANWREWASAHNRLGTIPARGRLCTLIHPDGSGHMGIVAEVRANGSMRTYEGNTSSGQGGSQADGDGLFERLRPAGFFSRFIDLN